MNQFSPTLSQGARASQSGKSLENKIESVLQELDLEYEAQVNFTNIYNRPTAKMDFYVPAYNMYMEVKNQNVAGSVDEKIPFCIANLLKVDGRGVFIYGGSHFNTPRGQSIINYAIDKTLDSDVEIVHEANLKDFLSEQTSSGQTPQ
jgi:galactitol-specific phosphotransferase system IIB component|tara:strand:+ start:752 stop:1192 length:441 start_codon:yes stop_codon:yes gene_type:complete